LNLRPSWAMVAIERASVGAIQWLASMALGRI